MVPRLKTKLLSDLSGNKHWFILYKNKITDLEHYYDTATARA